MCGVMKIFFLVTASVMFGVAVSCPEWINDPERTVFLPIRSIVVAFGVFNFGAFMMEQDHK